MKVTQDRRQLDLIHSRREAAGWKVPTAKEGGRCYSNHKRLPHSKTKQPLPQQNNTVAPTAKHKGCSHRNTKAAPTEIQRGRRLEVRISASTRA